MLFCVSGCGVICELQTYSSSRNSLGDGSLSLTGMMKDDVELLS